MSNQNTSNSTYTNSVKWVVVLVLFFVCSVGFAQEQHVVTSQELTTTSPATSAASESLNFMSWFMGTKQHIQTESAKELNGSNKKQLINSGIAPNRLLLKTFMKKAAVYNNAVA
jgi:predicted RND superfamily exporter protein